MVTARRGKVPAYHRALEGLVDLISRGGYRGGEALPAERKLCERLGVSRETLRSAIATLASLGLVESRRGSGTYVSMPRPTEAIHMPRGYSEMLRAAGIRPGSQLISQDMVPADARAAELLSVDEGSLLLRIRRVRLADGKPARLDLTHVNATLLPGIEAFDFGDVALFDVLDERYGMRPRHRSTTISIAKLSPEEAELLGTEAGRGTFRFADVCMAGTMEPLTWSETLVLPESCEVTNIIEAPALREASPAPPAELPEPSPDLPAYAQVRIQLLTAIMDGSYPPGAALPSETQLATYFGVTRKTVRRAVDDLVSQGFVRRAQGKGAFSLGAVDRSHARPIGFRERESLQQRKAQVRILGSYLRKAGGAFAQLLGIEPEDILLCVRRLNISEGAPVGYETTCIPVKLFPGIERLDLSVFSLFEIYGRFGHVVTNCTDVLGVISLSQRDAQLLHAEPGEPAMFFATTNRDANGIAIEYTVSVGIGPYASYEIRT